MKFKGYEFNAVQDEVTKKWDAVFVDPDLLSVSVNDVVGPSLTGHAKEDHAESAACARIRTAIAEHFKGPETFRDYQKRVLNELETQLSDQVTRRWMKRRAGRDPADKQSKADLRADFDGGVSVADSVVRILAANPIPAIEDQ